MYKIRDDKPWTGKTIPRKKIDNFPIKLKIKYDKPSTAIITIIGRSSFAERKKCSTDANVLFPNLGDDDI